MTRSRKVHSRGGRRKVEPVVAPVIVHGRRDSSLLDVLMHDESVHQLLDSRGDYAIFMLDANGYVASWNAAAQKIKGYPRDEIIGKHFSVFYPVEDRDNGKPQRDLETAAREGRFEIETTRVRRNGSEFWGNTVLSAVRDRTGALSGFVKVTHDLTEPLDAHARALVDHQKLKALNTELEAFTYSVSHDLRAPIRQIEGFSRILAEHLGKSVDPEVAHYLRRIQDGSRQMGRLVDDLLHLAQLGRQHAKPRRISLDLLIRDVVANLRSETTDRHIEWRIAALPPVICDPGLLHVVFTNLLSNAVKYTRLVNEAVIEIGQSEKNGELVLYVRDNGVGFDMRYADKLFGVFQRLHRVEDFEGTGVGLATVQRIVRKHNGVIWADGAPGKGATFSFTLGGSATAKPNTQ